MATLSTLSKIDQYIISHVDYEKQFKDRKTRALLRKPDMFPKEVWDRAIKTGSLAKRHLLEVYQWKFGKKEGTRRHLSWKKSQQSKGSLEYYVNKFGIKEGTKKYKTKCANVSVGYDRLVKKFGKVEALRIKAKHSSSSVVNKDTLVKRYGLRDGEKAYARLCANKRSPRMLKYWIEKGLTEEEAKAKVSSYQTRDKKYFVLKYGSKEGAKRWKEYCFRRGHSLERCIERHGEIKGRRTHQAWKDNQRNKGSKTYYVKKLGLRQGLARYRSVCASKSVTEESLILKYGKKRGRSVYRDLCTRSRGSSQAERELGSYVSTVVSSVSPGTVVNLGSTNPYMVFLTSSERKRAHERKFLLPDIAIPEWKLIVEYNGDLFHASPYLFKDDSAIANPWTKETVKVVREKDKVRKRILRHRGFRVLTIWESYYKQNPNETKKRLKELLHETCKTARKN